MATNVQRGGLGFEKFFRRRNPSTERTKDSEKSLKTGKNDAENSGKDESSKIGKLFGQKSANDKNNSNDREKEATTDETTEKPESNKSSKKSKHTAESSSSKEEDKKEACKEYVIKDDVGQVKLTEIINNSIKEAVLNIVKETVCPLGDPPPDLRPKETVKKCPGSMGQETQDKENKPGSPKHFASLFSGANKTFDSHLCRSQCPQSSRGSSRNPCKSSEQHERVTVSHCNRESPTRTNKSNKKVVKCPKQKEKCAREVIPKVCRSTKGQNSNFRTDNRRMTGNVNIYICSEANENTKDKQKSKNKKDCIDDSVSATSSTLSTSTSKLVAALRKKQRKNLEDSLSCVCETPVSPVKRYKSDCKIDDGVLCLCDADDSADAETRDSRSGSSHDDWLCGGEKFSNDDFIPGSDMGSLEQLCTSSASDECASYDRDDFWPCTTRDCPSCDGSSGGIQFNASKQVDKCHRDDDDRCSCCNLVVCKKNRRNSRGSRSKSWKNQSESRKSRDKTCRTTGDSQQFNKCLCVVEEEDDEGCCSERKKSEVRFGVCETSSTDKKNNEPDKSPSKSSSSTTKSKKGKSGSPKLEKKKSNRSSKLDSSSSQKELEEKGETGVDDVDEKPESPKLNLLSSLRKNFKKRSSSKEVAEPTNTKVEESQRNSSEVRKPSDDNNATTVDDGKQKNSFFQRSIKKAMGIVKARKSEDDQPITPDGEETKTEGKDTSDRACSETEIEKLSVGSSCPLKDDSRCRSKIATAISSRRSCGATSNEGSNASVPYCQAKKSECSNDSPTTQNPRKPESSQCCKCGNVSERPDCCCKKPEPKEEVCKCQVKCGKTKSGTSICCQKPINPRIESCACCPVCGNHVEKCVCCCRKAQPIESDSCKCCPRCTRPVAECTCCNPKQETTDRDCCNRCWRPNFLCCCEQVNRSLPNNSCRPSPPPMPPDCQDTSPCSNCCNPKAQCRCVQKCSTWECRKSMICIYCDKPQEKCLCKAPIRKCSQCGLPQDVCNCKPLPCYDCSGRQITQEPNDGPSICVTAWKPRRNVRRYFSRNENDADGLSEEDCACFEKSMPYGSDRLPYQKGTVFSDVMSELQQKISGSVCCEVCRNVPCNCCCNESENTRLPRRRLSTIAERRPVCQTQDRSRSKSPAESCRCGKPRRKSVRKVGVSKICGRCRTSPCRCRRSSASPRKKPAAKCYYCKSSPCVCSTPSEPANLRPFRKAESSHRRRKECNSTVEHTNADVGNEDNGHRGRETSQHVVPCPGRQQPRKYRYRQNSTG